MSEIDVAVFAFDDQHKLRLVNRAGERLLGRPVEQLLWRTADDISLAACLDGSAPRVLNIAFPGGSGQWQVRRGSFRQGGLPHTLVVLSDVNVPLRQQEREAWHRLIRVLGHELNNSLAPIKSIAGSLESIASQDPMPEDWREDMRRGLGIIAGRTDALSRFTTAYTALARLPRPNMRAVDLSALVERVARLEMRKTIQIEPGAPVAVQADPDQLEQLLINLMRNAVDAALETGGAVRVGWQQNSHRVSVYHRRRGAGSGEPVESVRAVLYDQAAGIRHRSRPRPPDRRSARRHADAGAARGRERRARDGDAAARIVSVLLIHQSSNSQAGKRNALARLGSSSMPRIRFAMYSPTTGPNLKPSAVPPPATQTFENPGKRSMMKFPDALMS